MTSDLFWIFVWNVIFNSVLTFLTLWGLCQLVIKIFRIKNPRYIVFLLVIPIIKLLIDPCFYECHQWALVYGINPLLAEKGSRFFSIGIGTQWICAPFIRFSINNQWGFSLSDCIALWLPFNLVKIIVSLFISITMVRFIYFCLETKRNVKQLIVLIKKSTAYVSIIESEALGLMIKKMRVEVKISSLILTPIAFGFFKRKILLPKKAVHQWKQEEIEAVIAHEIEHLKWYDHYLGYVLRLIQSIFWWMPLKWITGTIEKNIETHCDRAIFKFGLMPHCLVQALLYTLKSHRKTMMTTCSLSGNHSLFFRINALKELKQKPLRVGNKVFLIKSCLVVMVGIAFLVSKLWVF